ncbi:MULTISPECIES: SDR family oxidoreductase [Paraburkholderia]|uniref:SDR family oxidoreductase n=1 Tax=Paraburkholderia madseniana TaxID=2599607 RepID=A0A6N6W9E3_9BURK|nr:MULTISPECIES: SDR family oxidoreductase [Paraburkholderia]KAE8757275.1 SDR family oxidoreductase [Paraburkholderia madseniana]MCX4145258.1 SDR family oxidoreductase [Paraburkholderia madseniana]MDN7148208.1 SDR family oxidoreductase [Paraburkholderia sp. WS6]MDQ6407088.1 SDR family oxidoreductase [Paraburkholderia madseniana]
MLVTQYFSKDLYKGKTVFVTGGGSGINLGVAKNFAALGANVAICGRTQEMLDAAAAELRAFGTKVSADVRDSAPLEAALEKSRAALGAMDVLVCGAAGNFLVPAEKLSPNGFKTVIDIDLLGSFNATRSAFEQLKETKGTILYISAGMAYMPHAFQVHVGAAKAGIDMMMKNIALEWGRFGIRANSIVPGPIEETEGLKRLSDPAEKKKLINAVPLRRTGTVDDIGQVAAFLAPPLASYITGCVVVCDGGQNLPGSALFNMGAEQMLRAQQG